jgi:hypothetical protein
MDKYEDEQDMPESDPFSLTQDGLDDMGEPEKQDDE